VYRIKRRPRFKERAMQPSKEESVSNMKSQKSESEDKEMDELTLRYVT
jgi:hypothetical protein